MKLAHSSNMCRARGGHGWRKSGVQNGCRRRRAPRIPRPDVLPIAGAPVLHGTLCWPGRVVHKTAVGRKTEQARTRRMPPVTKSCECPHCKHSQWEEIDPKAGKTVKCDECRKEFFVVTCLNCKCTNAFDLR